MITITRIPPVALFAMVSLFAAPAQAASTSLKVMSLFSNNMVLQRDASDAVWGSAGPGDKIAIKLGDNLVSAVANSTGRWKAILPKMPAGGAFDLAIADNDQKLICHNVTFGEVWLASGQSNMVYALGWDAAYNAADIASSTDPDLRIFTVAQDGALAPKDDVRGSWQPATPNSVKGCSGVAYFYARELRKALGVPVGIIVSAYGATAVETWTSLDAIAADPAYKAEAEKSIGLMAAEPEAERQFPISVAEWQAKHGATDDVNAGEQQGWAKPEFDDSPWATVEIPKNLAGYGLKSGGVVWLRKTFTLPASAASKDFYLGLNWTDQTSITVYFNGVSLGELDPSHRFYHHDLRAHVPKSLIHEGTNTVAIRLMGLVPTAYDWVTTQMMGIPVEDPKSDDNKWKLKIERQFPPQSADDVASLPIAPSQIIRNTETAMYNAMLAPLIPYTIMGTIWYQGESNANNSQQYASRLSLMIADWRKRWALGPFPFYLVQLANYGSQTVTIGPSRVAEVRWAQFQVAKSVAKSGLAVTIDVGEESIHPRNKKTVGQRLALIALANTYGKPVEFSGPLYSGYKIDGASIRISFNHAAGLMSKDGPLKTFQIAGADKKWVTANAKIDGGTVVVSAASIASPVAVRYGWADNPPGCNLYDAAGLPASPFRTDDWKD